eukprot:scaffold79069_cov39-Phaeocystis_antarctica.AAC.1
MLVPSPPCWFHHLRAGRATTLGGGSGLHAAALAGYMPREGEQPPPSSTWVIGLGLGPPPSRTSSRCASRTELLTTYDLRLTSYYLLFTTYDSPRRGAPHARSYLLLTTDYLLLTTYYLLLTTHYLLLTTHYLRLTSSRCASRTELLTAYCLRLTTYYLPITTND